MNGALAFKLRGDILQHGKRDPVQALEAYRQAVRIKPGYLAGQAALVRLLLAQNSMEQAEAELNLGAKGIGDPKVDVIVRTADY